VTAPALKPFERLSIFFPMWNEEAYCRRAVDAARDVCDELVAAGRILDYEIVVVDDASTDATGRIADDLAAQDAHVRVVHHPHNRKLGGSIKSGFDAATGDVVLYTDADLPFEMPELVRALRVMQMYEADVISAYRHDRTGEGPRRAVYSFVYNALVRAMFDLHVRDVNFAFKLVRRRVLDQVELVSEGSFIDVELLVRTRRSGFEIQQIGVDYFPRTRGVSTLSSFGVIRTMVGEMLRLRSALKDVGRVESPTL
jgi:glycosyltransferase involved in cell wall biosynthesis